MNQSLESGLRTCRDKKFHLADLGIPGPAGMFKQEHRCNVLQKLGGWSDYKMALRSAHLAPEHLAEHANRLNGIVVKSVEPDNVTKLKIR